MFKITKANRSQVKLKCGFFGPSGSGKTYSALRFAKGLVGDYSKICVLDTENGSASLYSHLGEFSHCDFHAPFAPQRYIEAIQMIEKTGEFDCLIIDSISHEWEGTGGCLEIQTNMGGRYQDWAKVTPMHNKFIQTILQSKMHVMVTGRSKIDYSMDKSDNGRTTVTKQGMKSITREGFEYELTLSFQIAHNHYASIDKDRTNLFSNSSPFIVTEEIGEKVNEWNANNDVDLRAIRMQYWELLKEFHGGKEHVPEELTEAAKHMSIANMQKAINEVENALKGTSEA